VERNLVEVARAAVTRLAHRESLWAGLKPAEFGRKKGEASFPENDVTKILMD